MADGLFYPTGECCSPFGIETSTPSHPSKEMHRGAWPASGLPNELVNEVHEAP